MDSGMAIALVSLAGTGFLTWLAYMSKNTVEVARILAVLKIKTDEHGRRIERLEEAI